MTSKKERGTKKQTGCQQPVGVWNRDSGAGPTNPIRVRTKRLDEINGDKIALAYWLLAKQIVDNGSDEEVTEAEARQVAVELESPRGQAKPQRRKRG